MLKTRSKLTFRAFTGPFAALCCRPRARVENKVNIEIARPPSSGILAIIDSVEFFRARASDKSENPIFLDESDLANRRIENSIL